MASLEPGRALRAISEVSPQELNELLAELDAAPLDDFTRNTLKAVANARLKAVASSPMGNGAHPIQAQMYVFVEEAKSPFSEALRAVSQELEGKGLRFACSPKAFEVASRHWKGGPGFQASSRENVTPSEALGNILESPSSYALDCLTATSAVAWLALLKVLGHPYLNQLGQIGLGANALDRAKMMPGVHYQVTGSATEEADENWASLHLRPGDWVYFSNWNVSLEGRARGWQGANALYLGKNPQGQRLYFAHPLGTVNEERLVHIMNQHRMNGSLRPASLSTLLARISINPIKPEI